MRTLKSKLCMGVLSTLAAWLTLAAYAQDSKVAYINTQRITTESAPAKAASAKLEQEFSKRQKDLVDVQNNLKAMNDKYEREAPTMSESQRTAKQKEFAEQNRDFQRRQREFREDLSGRQNEEFQQVLEKANKAVRQVADSEKYDIVVQDVVYVNPKNDITDKVLKILSGAK